jgi:predicted metal-dependent enzyme (double-stranded beta helix superfamily)
MTRHPTEHATRLAAFVEGMDALVARHHAEADLLEGCDALLRELVRVDDWLPPTHAAPHPQFYQQYALHIDAQERYSVVSFVWGPGQRTPVHDHGVWGVIGMLRGSERSEAFSLEDGRLVPTGSEEILMPGDTSRVSPVIGDIHQVSNVHQDRVSISVHVYGTDIGKQLRHVYDPITGAPKPFVSGYAAPVSDASS